MRERHLFDRSSVDSVTESRVMHDLAVAYVDSMVQIAATRCDDV
jgi:hypothetical protein